MVTKKTTRRPAKPPAPCPDCKSDGQTSETFLVGGRKKHESTARQEALCMTCLGTGEAPTP
ncbi:hypothetical protein [Streptomyces sp. NBC_00648]|uniref:hypothetical protein n=1 Tax=Streptomyces sp. NBC_00648 TaxID=2975797 RepID=UPI0032517D21